MAISYLLGTAAFAVLAAAGTPPWAGPAPTAVQADGVRVDFLGAMPEPTSPAELKARAAPPPDYLCGYVTGDIENSVYCSAIRTCVFNTVYSAQACCIQNTLLSGTQYTSCSFYTSCQPYATGQATAFDEHVTSCNSLYPVCFTYSYTDIGFVNYGCSTTAYSSAVQLTYSGEALASSSASPTIIRDTASSQAGGSSTSGTSTSSTVSGGAPTQSTSSATSAGATAPAAPSSGKKSNAGAIAGGVVGGVAIIAILIAAIVFILSRRKKNQIAANPTVPPMQQQQYVGAPPMGPGSPGAQQQMPQQGYYQQPGQPMPYGQPGMQPDYNAGLQPGSAAPVYYGQDQKSMPGFGEQAGPQSPAGTFNPSSVSPQQTGMSEAPTDGARSSIAPQHSGTQAQPVFEIGETK